ncbi:hypothetical protein [Companilactobacillus ginsenosidimutans]|uniref:Uncharacterized protein n=1 Tax=Companilactobacillus ginsenosidimutans TaxID=1007676 RepID=A0A0H4QHZ3_9LACO|nr:hypothetical protein [Companilactobacillus ginsenosidimutans]AKP66641.1 hypothetical protein ABM34_03095 [Companilactobacillus ginsenosidimutans]
MSNQRTNLAKKVGQRIWFSATVGEFTHKRTKGGGKGPVLLLKDIDETDKKGRVINPDVTDHVWVNANKSVFSLGKEILPNDVLLFTAVVRPYGIVRDDVINKRDAVIAEAKEKNQDMFSDYREDYLDWKDSWQDVLQENKDARQQMQQGVIDRKTYQQIEKNNIESYKKSQPNGVAVKENETKIVQSAQNQRKSMKLVDYELEDLQDVKFLKEKRLYHGWTRLKISKDDMNRIKFTKYLAARSFAYRDGVPFDAFDNKK